MGQGGLTQIGAVVLGVRDVERATRFWSAALGARLRAPAEPGWASLRPPGGRGPNLSLQLTDTPPADFPHTHLDLYADDRALEVERLVSLGARVVPDWPYPQEEHDFTVLEDPDGNRFCVADRPDR